MDIRPGIGGVSFTITLDAYTIVREGNKITYKCKMIPKSLKCIIKKQIWI